MNLYIFKTLAALKDKPQTLTTLSHHTSLPLHQTSLLIHTLLEKGYVHPIQQHYHLSAKGFGLWNYTSTLPETTQPIQSVLIILDTPWSSSVLAQNIEYLISYTSAPITLLTFDHKVSHPNVHTLKIKPNLLSTFNHTIQETLSELAFPVLILNGHTPLNPSHFDFITLNHNTLLLKHDKKHKTLYQCLVEAMVLDGIPMLPKRKTHRLQNYLLDITESNSFPIRFNTSSSQHKQFIREFQEDLYQLENLLIQNK